MSEAVGVSSGVQGLPLMFLLSSVLWFVGVVPMKSLAVDLAILCYMYCVPSCSGWVLWACL